MSVDAEEQIRRLKGGEKKSCEDYVKDIILADIKKNSKKRSPLLAILEDIQSDIGYIPKDAMLMVSEQLKIPLSRVYSVATFYNDFKRAKRGEHLIRVCLGTACCVKESESCLSTLEKHFGIMANSTTPDKFVTIETVNCFGACNLGPIIEVDGKIISKADKEKISSILQQLKTQKSKIQ